MHALPPFLNYKRRNRAKIIEMPDIEPGVPLYSIMRALPPF